VVVENPEFVAIREEEAAVAPAAAGAAHVLGDPELGV
jgi:hypothetical protein